MPEADDTLMGNFHPLFQDRWQLSERSKGGDIIDTEFDGERVIQSTRFDRQRIRDHLRNTRAEERGRNGFTEARNMRHIAEIPDWLWFRWCKQYGNMNMHKDRKLLKRLIKEYGCGVVRGGF